MIVTTQTQLSESKPLFGYIVTDENGQWMQDRFAKAWLTDFTITGPGEYTQKGWQGNNVSLRKGGIRIILKGRTSLHGLGWYYDQEHSLTNRTLSRAWEIESVGWTCGIDTCDTIRIIREIPREEALAICYDEINPYLSKGWFTIRDKDTQRHAIVKCALELLDAGRFSVTGFKNHNEAAICTPAVTHPNLSSQFFHHKKSMKLKGDVVALFRLALVKFGIDYSVDYDFTAKKYPKDLSGQKKYTAQVFGNYEWESFETPVYNLFSSLEIDCILGAVENYGSDAFEISDPEQHEAHLKGDYQEHARQQWPALLIRTETLTPAQDKAFNIYRKALPKTTAIRLRAVLENMLANNGKFVF